MEQSATSKLIDFPKFSADKAPTTAQKPFEMILTFCWFSNLSSQSNSKHWRVGILRLHVLTNLLSDSPSIVETN